MLKKAKATNAWIVIQLFVYIFFSNILYSQDKLKLDSLAARLLVSDISQLDYIQTQVLIANHYVYTNIDTATHIINDVLTTSKLETILPSDYYDHFVVKAWTHHGKKEYEDAEKYYNRALDIVSKGTDRAGYIELWINLAALYEQTRDTAALSFVKEFMLQLDTAKTKDDKIGWILGHQYKARIYGHQKHYEKALNLLLEALELPFLADFPEYSIGVLKYIGVYQKEIGDHRIAERSLKKGLSIDNLYPYQQKMLWDQLGKLYLDIDSLDGVQVCLNRISNLKPLSEVECHLYNRLYAVVSLKKTTYTKALDYMESAKKCANTMQDDDGKLADLLLEANIKTRLQQESTSTKLIEEAERLLAQKPNLSTPAIRSSIATIQLLNKLSLKDPSLLVSFDQQQLLAKQQNRFLSDKKLKEVVIKYEADQKEQENQLLLKDAALKDAQLFRQKIFHGLVSGLLLLAIGFLYVLSKNFRLEKEHNILLQQEKEQLIFEKEELVKINESLQKDKSHLLTTVHKEVFKDKYEIKGESKSFFIPMASIIYIQSEDEGCRFYIKDEASQWFDIRLKDVIASLPNIYFTQIFRSTVVNKAFIKWVNHTSLSLLDDTSLKISRTYKKNIIEMIKK